MGSCLESFREQIHPGAEATTVTHIFAHVCVSKVKGSVAKELGGGLREIAHTINSM